MKYPAGKKKRKGKQRMAKEILAVIDMQNDFIDGALGTKEAQAIVGKVAEVIKDFDGEVVYTRDTHSDNYLDTQEGKKLPVPHCIQGTEGWEICDTLKALQTETTKIIDKPVFGSVELAQYLYDDAVDTSNKSIVVDWYYKKPLPGGGTALHLVKFTGRDLLYASENDPAMAEGFYPHGQYPVVFDVLYPEAGTPCGFGMIAVSKDPQQYIDRLSGNLLEMSMKASTPRFWVKKGCGVNAQEFLDWSKPLVEVEGSIDEERLRQISLYNLDGQWVNMLQLKINELKETSNSRDVTQGSVSGGVTAASAIAALQEAGSKSSRDTLRASYRAFERVVELVIELIRAYYTETRPFRVAAPGAQGYTFCTYSNAGLRARVVGMDTDGGALCRAPAFDVSVHAQKESPYATASQNELARQLYQLGVFNPAFAQQAVPMLEMMQFPGRDKVLEAVRGSIAPPQPETPEADAGTDALQKAQAEKNRVITASAR